MPTFVVTTHQHPTQLGRLASRLAPHPVIVHVDAKVEQADFEDATTGQGHLVFLSTEQRVRCTWAGFSLTRALQRLLHTAVETTDPDDHIVWLSGADYPLRPVDDFVAYLRTASFRQHLKYFEVGTSDDHQRRLSDRRHYRDVEPFSRARRGSLLAKANEATRRALEQSMRWRVAERCPHELTPMRGSAWTALTARCVTDLLALTTPAVDRWLSRTFAPDELYLHTLLHATTHRADTEVGGPVPYAGPHHSPLANLHLIDDSLDKFFTISDVDRVLASDQWFVRKVAPGLSDTLLDHLDARMATRSS